MSNQRRVSVGLVQMACAENPRINLERASAGCREAARLGANILCLPELFLTPYFCQSEDHIHFASAEAIPGPTTYHFSALARELGCVIICSLFEKRAAGLYHNTTAVLDADGSYLGKYRKMHIPDDPLFYEKFYFTPGDLGFRVFSTRYGRIGVLICWDQWFPEAARLTALRGADILFYPTAIGWHPSEKAEYGEAQHQSWELIQRSHAVANGCYVASVNRVGHEGDPAGGIEFWGRSFVCDPQGTILDRGDSESSRIVIAPIDLDRVDVTRTHWPFLRDRRIDAYQDLTRRFLDDDPPLPAEPTVGIAGKTPDAAPGGNVGYRMPAEWEPQEGIWLSWPHNPDTWPSSLEEVKPFYVELIRAITADEIAWINVADDRMEEEARRLLALADVDTTRVRFPHLPTNDAWCRDYGAIFVHSRGSGDRPRRAATRWNYNCWGGKYPPFDLDQKVAERMAEILNVPVVVGDMVLEGGAIDVNGAGWLLTTEACLLNTNRNPELDLCGIEQRLRHLLGVEEILWLPGASGIEGDDTDGHIDNLARFTGPQTVVMVVEDDPSREGYASLRANRQRLESWRSAAGRQLDVHELPTVPPMTHQGQRLPASYANFLITNHSVLVPQFGVARDDQAMRILGPLFPGRRIVGIDCRVAIRGLGSIHCLTQQVPK